MKRCLCCGHECSRSVSTCPMCGEGSWCDIEGGVYRRDAEPQLEPVTQPDASPKPIKRGKR